MTREKTLCLVVTFGSTTQAIAGERQLQAAGLPGRLIPVPRAITASCGLAWKAPPAARPDIEKALTAGQGFAGMYELEL